ncbi:S-adenosyl-L-methionine-dependent methyltransferase [Apiospora kogelbergensis]
MTGHSIPDPASVEENGRTYTGYYREGRYLLPNDGAEQDRLDLQHQVWRLLLDDALHLAPLDWGAAGDDARNVLDIGTGTGIWPIEFSEANPGARVVGTDLSLIQPPPDAVPPNCSFVREDSEEDEWVHEVEFDYIHMRAM